MTLENWRNPVGTVAVIATVLQFLSGIVVCRQYYKKRSTADSSSLPFTCGLVSSAIWLRYGIAKKEDKVVIVNTVGVILFLLYTVIYIIYTLRKSDVLKQLFMVFAFLSSVAIYAHHEKDKDLLLHRLGLIACSLTLLFVAAPLSNLYHVLKVKSTECLPFPMILMSFFVSLLWCVYGVIIQDDFMQVPNLIGCALSGFQLALFVVYPSSGDCGRGYKTLQA